MNTSLDPDSLVLTIKQGNQQVISAQLADEADRSKVENFLWQLLPTLRAPPVLVRSAGGHFMDKPVSYTHLDVYKRQDQDRGADKDQERDLVGQRPELPARQRADRAFAVAGNEDEQGDEQARQQNPQQALAHRCHPLPPRFAPYCKELRPALKLWVENDLFGNAQVPNSARRARFVESSDDDDIIAEASACACGCVGGAAPSAIGASADITRSGGKVTITSVPMRSFDLSVKVPPCRRCV